MNKGERELDKIEQGPKKKSTVLEKLEGIILVGN